MNDKKLRILESKLALLLDYHTRCPKHKKSIVARMMSKIDDKLNLYYARLSRIA